MTTLHRIPAPPWPATRSEDEAISRSAADGSRELEVGFLLPQLMAETGCAAGSTGTVRDVLKVIGLIARLE